MEDHRSRENRWGSTTSHKPHDESKCTTTKQLLISKWTIQANMTQKPKTKAWENGTQKAQNKAHKDENNSFRKAQSMSRTTKNLVKVQLKICISGKPKRENTFTKKKQKEGAKRKNTNLPTKKVKMNLITKRRAYKYTKETYLNRKTIQSTKGTQ